MYSMPDYHHRLDAEVSEAKIRVVVDELGTEWQVREVPTPQPWAHAARCLIFSSSAVVRRLWSFPEGWTRMASRELLGLIDMPPR